MNKSDQSYTVTPDTAATLRVDLTDAAAARGDVACASHIGLRHETNQDAAALGIDGSGHHIVLVVADGVSSTEGAEECARVASHTARDYLTATMDQGLPINDDDTVTLFERTFQKTHEAVVSGSGPIGACTLAVAVATHDRIVVGNIGDTRTYWFPDDGDPVRLSIDDSMAQAQMDLGLSREEAERGMGAHAITKWIGASATDVAPRVMAYQPQQSGWLLVCSDGLWNHVPDAGDLARLIADLVSKAHTDDHGHASPAGVANGLIAHANNCGGHDNITVALWRRDS
ncbi:PP2C family protein-serine/threonine phosphatase [Cutibacterium acnes]|uniref:PP2C family protein-serine/threonine phosphatase n=1 Tax=Cutibacterium acnes TaxID=1747 RepID=UPI0008A61171|nr:PP2C family protein-serine/threonine phosphatase [Cutibacterium acnes]OFK52315.1 protein phosphatase [Propionibacterium sp. HMSC069G10]MDF2200729.1 PP2C family protein-serine/threonine phosphatase [Cutibacterium acnes subsp. defendens]MDF2229309.1 PP2C family protein-serine/threonine phosphatase [Cutibacterium acnes subsp. defendens]MDF2243064.1 PP2C family protein-serine/threonine phosphatase [Cutibacterium acnes subsp. defendens]MDF2251887.1 PP2C family protein-serine/threonine phosphatas